MELPQLQGVFFLMQNSKKKRSIPRTVLVSKFLNALETVALPLTLIENENTNSITI